MVSEYIKLLVLGVRLALSLLVFLDGGFLVELISSVLGLLLELL